MCRVSAGSGSDRIVAQRMWMIHLAIARGTDTTMARIPEIQPPKTQFPWLAEDIHPPTRHMELQTFRV